jgi:hypothetical protein
MNIQTWYFIFHPASFTPWYGFFGHVEACGVTGDGTWFFFNPARTGGEVAIHFKHDDVNLALALAFERGLVIRTEKTFKTIFQIWPLMTCASVCAHMVGLRAFSPAGFKRKLLKNGAEIIHDGRTTGKQAIKGRSGARASGSQNGTTQISAEQRGISDF